MDDRYPRNIIASDGTHFVVRAVQEDDRPGLEQFFRGLSEAEQWFSRVNSAYPKTLKQWFDDMDEEHCLAIVAMDQREQRIAAYALLERHISPCLAHVAHVRIMVGTAYRAKGLGSRMIMELSDLASCMGIEKVVAEFTSGKEDVAIKAASSLNFVKQATLKDYVMAPDGELHDLVIMVKNIGPCIGDF